MTNTNQMSKDRVRFTINSHVIKRTGIVELLREVFGLVEVWPNMKIICRPSQFCRFMIKRNEMDMTNGFKELEPELFTPTPNTGAVDVSKRPNQIQSPYKDYS